MLTMLQTHIYIYMQKKHGIYNIASGDYKPLKSFVYEMKNITHSKSELDFGSVPVSPTGHGFIPQINNLKSTGWESKVSFKNGITEIVEHMK